MIIVDPVENGTYFLSPRNNRITFGSTTNINVLDPNDSGQQNGVYGGPATTWNVTNEGYISANRALYLKGPATVTNSGTLKSTQFRAVYLDAGGTVINEKGGVITNNGGGIGGGAGGVYISGGLGVVTNAGSITGAVDLEDGGSVTNDADGTMNSGNVAGAQMGVDLGAGGDVYNFGSITGRYFGAEFYKGGTFVNEAKGQLYGVYYGAALGLPAGGKTSGVGGTLTNDAGATVSGKAGVVAQGAAAFVTNSGSIAGTSDATQTIFSITLKLGDGVWLDHGGTVTNNADATISGARYGVEINDAGTIADAGTITGVKDAVRFTGSGRHTLHLETGANLVGAVDGSMAGGATNVLVLTGNGTSNSAFLHFETLTLQKDAKWTLGGTSSIGATTVGGGAHLTVTGSLTTAMTLDAKSVATIDGAVSGRVTFNGSAELALVNPYGGTVSGFGVGDRIDFLSPFYETGDKVKIVGQKLEIVNSEIGVIETLKLGGSYAKSEFKVGQDSNHHLLLSFAAPSTQTAGGETDAARMALAIRGDAFAGSSFAGSSFAEDAAASHGSNGALDLAVPDGGWRLAASGGFG